MDYEELLRRLDRHGVQFAVLHGWDSSKRWVSDLDLVVAAKSLPLLEEFLRKFYRILQIVPYEATGYAFVVRDEAGAGNGCSIIDATTDYRWQGRIFFREEELFHQRRRWGDYWVVGPEQEFSYLLVKKICEKGAVAEDQRGDLRKLAAHLGSSVHAVGATLFGARLGSRVVDWITTEKWSEFDCHMPEMRRALRWQPLKRDPFNPLRYWLQEIARLWQRWRFPTGLFVVVLGSDGAGKSTVIQHLEGRFQGAFRRTQSSHFRPRLLKGHPSTTITQPHAKAPYNGFVSAFKLLYYLLDYIVGYWLQVRLALARSTLVIFDRYYHDLFVDSRRYRYGGPTWLLRLGGRLVPRPDLFLVLDAPETHLIQRKAELPLEELKRQRARFRELARESDRFIYLDGTAPVKEVTQQAAESIFAVLERRCSQRRWLWFGHPAGTKKAMIQREDTSKRYENINQT